MILTISNVFNALDAFFALVSTRACVARVSWLIDSLANLIKTVQVYKDYTIGANATLAIDFAFSVPSGYRLLSVFCQDTGYARVFIGALTQTTTPRMTLCNTHNGQLNGRASVIGIFVLDI